MSAIFISHRSSDNAVAAEVHLWLVSREHRSVFLDFDPADGIPAGRNWEAELYQRMRSCRAVIVPCSVASTGSKWVFAEITYPRALGKHLLPVKIDDCTIDSVISDRQVIHKTVNKEEAYQRPWRGLLAAGTTRWKGWRSIMTAPGSSPPATMRRPECGTPPPATPVKLSDSS